MERCGRRSMSKTNIPVLSKGEKLVLASIRSTLWKAPFSENATADDWEEAYAVAMRHAIGPILWVSVQKDAERTGVPQKIREQLRTRTIAFALAEDRILKVQERTLDLLREAGILAAVHKGASVARLYPAQYLRTMGDIDILVKEEAYQHAAQILAGAGYQKSDEEHWYHILLFSDGITIEIHKAIARTPVGEAGKRLEKLMADAVESACPAVYGDKRFPVLKLKHQAVALLMHMQKHMTSSGIGLRQLCDWMVFVASVDQKDIQDIIEAEKSVGLEQFSRIMTWTCVRFLGLGSDKAWHRAPDETLCCLAIEDVMRGGNMAENQDMPSYSNLFLEDVGHFESPFRGSLRTAHVLLHRLNLKAIQVYPKASRIVLIRPVLLISCGIAYIKEHERDKILTQQRRIALDRKRLYDAADFFRVNRRVNR